MILNQNNFSLRVMEKQHDSPSAPKLAFYSDYRICLALEGEAVWEIEDRSYSIRAGDVVFLNLGQQRSFTSFGAEGFRLCIFRLDRSAFSEIRHFMYFMHRVKHHNNVFSACPLAPILEEIVCEWERAEPMRYELASVKLTEFLIKAQRLDRFHREGVTKGERAVLDLMNWIDGEIPKGLSLSLAAKKAGMTESTFSRRFLALNGISFKQYVIEKRIRCAVCLLKETDLNIIDVAFGCGFDSVSGFYQAFRQKTGTTPGKYSEEEL